MPAAGTIPGPTGHPVFGMARELRRDLLGTLERDLARYGELVCYRVGPARGPRSLRRQVVAVHSPDGVGRVLSDEAVFTRETRSFAVLRELFGENVATATGDLWLRQRRMLQPLFTRDRVKLYASATEAEARGVLDTVPAHGGVLDIVELMERYTLRVLGRTLFGGGQGIDDVSASELSRLVPLVGTLVQSRAGAPVRLPLTWPTPANRRFRETREQLYRTVDRVVAMRAGGDRDVAADLVGTLEQTRDSGTDGPPSPGEIRDQALIFLLAGHTTTTSALTSTLYLLASNPEVQERVTEEAVSTADDLEINLVGAAVREGLRLYPPAHVIGRRAAADVEIDGYTIPAGTDVLVSPWVTHRHSGLWPEPASFDPERFLGSRRLPQYAYFPFGGGGRTCIGRHFALQEVTIMVRELLRRYRLEALDDELPRAQLITLRPSGPVRVLCQPR
jgi:cytochrome P450